MVTHWGPVFEPFLTGLAESAAEFDANAVLHFVPQMRRSA